ncbi:taurine dioxygenase-like protein [Emiliania huxleyi CCMP1516]|uniref:TauD/TfdA-like domain-containing protein n=2 Tax=Emiliania huxleyi TaxID=2903 RepID=A0A0D3IF92_EMIH1|nr:taurine dioxygenase-like protein [Emiliania huxleyi CCMP1516]EOD09927.1 taurine dioxygenase-like protein [Emiliania huxleyi CCMP1516]|eukprot:XP_005762356.1 taurine dioxygenase-like protein [Emiliania huxleyi CCMP1516]
MKLHALSRVPERGVFSHVGYHIVRVAENGGGTIFAHQGGAFDALPEAEQERWQRLVSVNSNSGVLHPVVHEHPISGRKSVYLHLGMTGAVLEVTPPANDPKGIEKLRLLEQDEMRHLFQSYNALLNKGFATGAADLLGGAPRYGALVELQNLNSKPELNGQQGVVVGVLDRTNGRVAVELMEGQDPANPVKRPRMAVKPENLKEGDCIFIDNLAVAHRASPEAHKPSTEVGLRILHRTTIRAPQNFDPPYGLPPVLNVLGPNPLGGGGVWQGGGLGFRWDETIPMQN